MLKATQRQQLQHHPQQQQHSPCRPTQRRRQQQQQQRSRWTRTNLIFTPLSIRSHMLRMPTKMCAKVSQLGNKKKYIKKIPPIKREKSAWKQKGTGELRESEKFARLLHDEQSRRPTIFAYDLFTQPICWPSWRLHTLHFAPRKSKENLSQPWNCLWKFHRIYFFFDTWVVGERNLPSVCANNAVCTTKQGLKLVKFAWGNFVAYFTVVRALNVVHQLKFGNVLVRRSIEVWQQRSVEHFVNEFFSFLPWAVIYFTENWI